MMSLTRDPEKSKEAGNLNLQIESPDESSQVPPTGVTEAPLNDTSIKGWRLYLTNTSYAATETMLCPMLTFVLACL